MTKFEQALHSLFAFSASTRWIPCAGSMAYPANTADGGDAGEYADEGTAAHTLASDCLKNKTDAIEHLGRIIKGGKREFEVTEEFADHVQTYVDDVRRRSAGGYLMVEQRVSLEGVEGFDETNYGTSDAVIAMPGVIIDHDTGAIEDSWGVVEDLKFGQGERVYAWLPATATSLFVMDKWMGETDETIQVEPNYQLMMYALACLRDIELLVDRPKGIMIVISQPRVGSMSELWVPIAVLERFAIFAADAYKKAELAMGLGVEACEAHDAMVTGPLSSKFFSAGEKQCRWCKAATCRARDAKVREEVGADFDTIGDKPPKVPVSAPQLAKAMLAVPFIADWCNAVMAQAHGLVAAGTDIIGPDNKPYKFVEGKQGKRKWSDPKAAEAALLANLPREKVYTEVLITAPAVDKLFKKKAVRQTWEDVFKPLVKQAPGKPTLVMGSDPRAPFSPNAGADEFDVEEDDE